jgi:hypothetical protein
MDVIGDIVARERRSEAVALRTESRAGSYSYEKICTNAWKAGNLLTHYGVRSGATVGVDANPVTPSPIVAILGTTLLGANVRLAHATDADIAAHVVHADAVTTVDARPGTQILAYGDVPEESGVAHFEREAWSENPVRPPEQVDPSTVAVVAEDGSWSHETLLDATMRIVDDYDLDSDDSVALRTGLASPGALVAGVLAPLSVGATVLLGRDREGTVAVTTGEAPESVAIDPETVL